MASTGFQHTQGFRSSREPVAPNRVTFLDVSSDLKSQFTSTKLNFPAQRPTVSNGDIRDELRKTNYQTLNKESASTFKSRDRVNYLLNNQSSVVNKLYKDIRTMTPQELQRLESLEQTTSFSRAQILDLYVRFKSLCVLTIERSHKFHDKLEWDYRAKDIEKDYN